MKEIPLTQRQVALVDDEDYDELMKYKWFACKSCGLFYARRYGGKYQKNISMHSHITGYVRTDHIDGNGLNNSRGNLRKCSNAENIRNSKIRKDNSSGYKGVSFKRSNNKFQVRIRINARDIHLGLFKTALEAARAYNESAIKYFGEFARLNDV